MCVSLWGEVVSLLKSVVTNQTHTADVVRICDLENYIILWSTFLLFMCLDWDWSNIQDSYLGQYGLMDTQPPLSDWVSVFEDNVHF